MPKARPQSDRTKLRHARAEIRHWRELALTRMNAIKDLEARRAAAENNARDHLDKLLSTEALVRAREATIRELDAHAKAVPIVVDHHAREAQDLNAAHATIHALARVAEALTGRK